MYITERYAKQIVADVESVIQKKINLMDEKAMIIASTDVSRIGQFHEGAHKVISEKLDILLVEARNQFTGAQPGINLPIVIEGNIIGVIGITSEKEEDLRLGKIIKKLTEMLVFELYLKEQTDLKQRARNSFVEEWISHGNAQSDKTFGIRGQLIGIDIEKPKRAAVAHFHLIKTDALEIEAFEIQSMRDQVLQLATQLVLATGNGYLTLIGTELVFLINIESARMAEQFLLGIKEQVEKQHPVCFYCGIGRSIGPTSNMHKSYIEARQSMLLAKESQSGIAVYENMTLEYLLNELPLDAKNEYYHRIFDGCSPNEVKEWTAILAQFFANNFSLNLTASALFIHKNTLQYKLNKIARKTGFDPRNARDGVTLYLAILVKHLAVIETDMP